MLAQPTTTITAQSGGLPAGDEVYARSWWPDVWGGENYFIGHPGTPYYPPCQHDADCYQSHICDTDGHCAPVPSIDRKNNPYD